MNLINLINQKLRLSRPYIFILFNPPKVGSTSLVSSLRISTAHKYNTIHIHNEHTLSILCGIQNITVNEIIQYNRQLGKKIIVIDIFRTPIEHKISTFFENISYHFNNSEENINKYNLDLIIERFNKLFPYLCNTDYYRQVYNIPTIDQFDHKNKYICQIFNGVTYLKLRLSDSKFWKHIFYKLFNETIYFVKEYESSSKPYSTLYKSFLENYHIPCNLLNNINNEKLKYYLSDKEINDYLYKWQQKTTNKFSSFTNEEYLFYNKISTENQQYFNLQIHHYMDDGCICLKCSHKRKQLLHKIKNNYTISKDDYVIHTFSKNIKKINIINKTPQLKMNMN